MLHHIACQLVEDSSLGDFPRQWFLRGLQVVGLRKVVEIGFATHPPVLDHVAEHDYGFYFFLCDHLEEISHGRWQRSLRDNIASVLKSDMVRIDVVQLFGVLPPQDHSRVLICVIGSAYKSPALRTGSACSRTRRWSEAAAYASCWPL